MEGLGCRQLEEHGAVLCKSCAKPHGRSRRSRGNGEAAGARGCGYGEKDGDSAVAPRGEELLHVGSSWRASTARCGQLLGK